MASKNNEGVRLGVSATQMVLVMPKALAEVVGRLHAPKVVVGETETSYLFEKTDRGYQWSTYDKQSLTRGETMRLTIGIKALPEGTSLFGLHEVDSYEERDGKLIVSVLHSAMKPPRVMSPRTHDVRTSPPEKTPGIGTKFKQNLSADTPLPVVNTSGDPVGAPVTDEQLREAKAVINRAKQERGDELRITLDTQSGNIGLHKIVQRSL